MEMLMNSVDDHEKDKIIQSLKSQVSQLKAVIDSIPGSIYWKDLKLVYLGRNKSALEKSIAVGLHKEGMKKDFVIGKTDYDFFPKDVAEQYRTNDLEVIKSGKEISKEEELFLPGKQKLVQISQKKPLYNEQGKIIGIVGNTVDITDRKILEEALKRSNAVKKQFIANMSHGLRTPITGIMGVFEDLLDCVAKIKSKRDLENQLSIYSSAELLNTLLERVENNSHLTLGALKGLLQLCNEILETVRLESHTSEMPEKAFELTALIDAVMNLIKPTAMRKSLVLNVLVANDIPKYLFGSARYLSKALLNLVSNALKFTDKGSITVSAQLSRIAQSELKKGDPIHLIIQVIDTGIGILHEKFKTIFEHSSDLYPSYKGHYKGYGLGLYTVKQYIQSMKGSITVNSEVGKGTTFTLKLPLRVEDHTDHIMTLVDQPVKLKTPTTISRPILNDTQPKDNTRVLLVEDITLAAAVAKRMLRECGCRSVIDWAKTGEIALEKASNNDYDLIIMDIALPKMQGTEVAEKIRALQDGLKSKVPIVALTGHADPAHKKEFMALGINDLLIKPGNCAQMLRILQTYVFPKSNVKKSRKNQPVSGPTNLVLDWNASMKLDNVQQDAKQLQEYLSLLSRELKVTKKILTKGYRGKKMKDLRDELHRVRGALTYLVAPELDEKLKAFHDAVRATPQQVTTMEQTYRAVIKAIQHFQKAYAKGFKDQQ